MHVQFADWFRIASIDPKEVNLNARWTSVETLAKDSSADDALECARLFFGLPQKDPAFLDRFRAPFKSTAEKFSMLENNVELRVLAGATLVALLEYPDGWAEAAALLLTCGSFRELRPAPVGDIVRLAHEFLAARSALHRGGRPDLPSADKLRDELSKKMEAARTALAANGATNTLTDPLINVFKEISDGITSLVHWAQEQELQQAMRREESDVLWWLYAAESRDLRLPFARLKVPAATLIAAKEMADLTKTIPGPYAAGLFWTKLFATLWKGRTSRP